MTTADWALIISCGSLVIALASFVWNIWSKFIFPKPKLRVSIGIMCFIPNPQNLPDFISLNATNHGPSEVTLHAAITKKRRRCFQRAKLGLVNPLKNFPQEFNSSDGPFSGGLPKKIAMGEQFSVYFPLNKNWIKEDLIRFGFSDTFGRSHWCSKKNGHEFRKKLSEHSDLA